MLTSMLTVVGTTAALVVLVLMSASSVLPELGEPARARQDARRERD